MIEVGIFRVPFFQNGKAVHQSGNERENEHKKEPSGKMNIFA